jgi:deoxyribonuclease-4
MANTYIIGAHVSTAGGLYTAVDNAKKIGAQALQIFGASPRQWSAKIPEKAVIQKYQLELEKSKLGPVFLHAAYLVNLASPDEMTRAKSIANLTIHLQIAEAIGAEGLIFHVGSGKEAPKDVAMGHVASGVKQVLKNAKGKAKIILENSAGGGQKLGSIAKEIGEILNLINSDRAKVCFDTAHAFEAGIIESYSKENIKKLFDEWDQEVGLENFSALHVNDSKTVFNSHHDRHENIGEGYIGLDGFKNLANEKRINQLPWLLEVPGFDSTGPDKKNVDLLKDCFLV